MWTTKRANSGELGEFKIRKTAIGSSKFESGNFKSGKSILDLRFRISTFELPIAVIRISNSLPYLLLGEEGVSIVGRRNKRFLDRSC